MGIREGLSKKGRLKWELKDEQNCASEGQGKENQ